MTYLSGAHIQHNWEGRQSRRPTLLFGELREEPTERRLCRIHLELSWCHPSGVRGEAVHAVEVAARKGQISFGPQIRPRDKTVVVALFSVTLNLFHNYILILV